ncbi:MAG: hypothetical protein HY900_29940 [Deltaproteobacteria bacterium]|nr:hypothetical protein [Deltaproteobacteria bacterium]
MVNRTTIRRRNDQQEEPAARPAVKLIRRGEAAPAADAVERKLRADVEAWLKARRAA